MELQKLIYTVEDGIAVVTMNYMKNLNAIDEQMADELMYVVDKAEHDPDVRVLVIKGAERPSPPAATSAISTNSSRPAAKSTWTA